MQDKVLTDNPAEGVPRAKHQKEPPDSFSLEEAEAIIAYAAEKYPEPVYNMIEAWFSRAFARPKCSAPDGRTSI